MNKWMAIIGIVLFFPAFLLAQEEPRQYKIKPIEDDYKWKGSSSNSELPKPVLSTLVDDFQDSNLTGWWGFGDLLFTVVENSVGEYEPTMAGRSIRFEGQAKERYVGGCGRVLGLDASRFNAIKLVIKGNTPPKSGTLVIELYPARTLGWLNESQEKRQWKMRYEHRFAYTLKVNWKGWRVITIPFKDFLKDSPRVTERFWNGATGAGEGTLIQMQFLVLSAEKKGRADFQIDSISFVKDMNPMGATDILDY